MICIDGVNSMTGNAPDLAGFAALAREHDVLLYVDDAHGFGVIGERSAGRVVRLRQRAATASSATSDESYDNVVLVGGFSKAYSSLLAFIACPTALKQVLKTAAAALPVLRARRRSPRWPRCWRACGSTTSAATQMRARLHRLTRRVLDRLGELGHPHAEPAPASRSSRSRSPTPTASTPSATCCSTAGST